MRLNRFRKAVVSDAFTVSTLLTILSAWGFDLNFNPYLIWTQSEQIELNLVPFRSYAGVKS